MPKQASAQPAPTIVISDGTERWDHPVADGTTVAEAAAWYENATPAQLNYSGHPDRETSVTIQIEAVNEYDEVLEADEVTVTIPADSSNR